MAASPKSPQKSNASPAPSTPLAASPGAQGSSDKASVRGEERSPELGSHELRLSPLQGTLATDSAAAIQNRLYAILGHGNFQRLVVSSAALSMIVYMLHAFAYIIIGRPVDHWCRRPEELRHLSLDMWRNAAIPIEADGQFSRCTVYDPAISEDADEERHVVGCQAWEYDIGYAKDSIISNWDLVCDRQWLLSVSSSVFMLGPAVFAPLAGPISDQFGRKPVLMAAAGTLLGASLCAAGSQSFPFFLMARFVVAGSASATSLMLFTMIFEVTVNERRALYSLGATSIGGTVPLMLLELVSLFRPSWELAQALLLLPTVLLLIWCNSVEESPSWLIATSQLRMAQQVVLSVAKINGLDVSKARQAFQRLKQQIRPKDQAHSTSVSASSSSTTTEGAVQATVFYRRALSVAIAWFNLTFVYYNLAIMAVKRGGHSKAAHFGMQVLIFFGICWLLTKKGQRETLTAVLSSVAVGAAAYFAASFLALSALIPSLRSLVLCLCTGALAICYGYTAEVFPISIRSTGICLSYTVGRLGALLSSFLTAFEGVTDSVAMEAAFAVLMLLSAVAVQWLPEVFLYKKTTKPSSPVVLSQEERKKALKASLAATPSPRQQTRRRTDRVQPAVTPKRSRAKKMEPTSVTERSPIVSASATPKSL